MGEEMREELEWVRGWGEVGVWEGCADVEKGLGRGMEEQGRVGLSGEGGGIGVGKGVGKGGEGVHGRGWVGRTDVGKGLVSEDGGVGLGREVV